MAQPAQPDPAFEALLEFLKRSRGFDFTGYKRSTLMRRVEKRMKVVGLDGWDAYRDYLEKHEPECVQYVYLHGSEELLRQRSVQSEFTWTV